MLKPRISMRFSSTLKFFLTSSRASKKSYLAGELARVAVAAIEVQHDGVLGLKFAGILQAIVKKIDFVARFAPARKRGIHAPMVRPIGCVGCRHNQPIGLHAAIDLRDVTPDHKARWRASQGVSLLRQCLGALHTDAQQFLAPEDLLFPEEFVVFDGESNRLVKDNDIGETGITLKRVDPRAEAIEPCAKLALIGRRDRNPGGRQGFRNGSLGSERSNAMK